MTDRCYEMPVDVGHCTDRFSDIETAVAAQLE
jgi:hypothetical protein